MPFYKREKHASYSSHDSCKILSEELHDYYEGRHRSHLTPHYHRREKERNFEIKTNIKETFPLRQPPHFLFCKKALASIATPLGLEFIPQVKKFG